MNRKTEMTIALDQLPIRKCKKCGGITYVQTFQLRYCSAIQSPAGRAGLIFVQTGFSCTACTTPVVDMTEKPPEEPKKKETTAKPTDITAGDTTTEKTAKLFDISDFRKKE